MMLGAGDFLLISRLRTGALSNFPFMIRTAICSFGRREEAFHE
jgi:hypothetical protein